LNLTTHSAQTLAVIGGGITGRSLLYALAQEKHSFKKIFLFDSQFFSPACSWSSTAVVAPRGVTRGHSALGDLIVSSFEAFSEHFEQAHPPGVFQSTQYTGAISKLDQFQKRFSNATLTSLAGPIELNQQFHLAQEKAFVVDPSLYLEWLLNEAAKVLNLEIINEFVTGIDDRLITTSGHKQFEADKICYCTGAYTSFWKPVSKSIQGSYLEFSEVNLPIDAISLTLEGNNLVYHPHTKKLLIGSTTDESNLFVAPVGKLNQIYQFIKRSVNLAIPDFDAGIIRVGLREKSPKRMPYLMTQGRVSWIGGHYKNGYSMGLGQSQKLVKTLIQ